MKLNMEFDATQLTLGEVIKTGDHVIPRYQRSYAWEEENIRDLWNDLANSETGDYFLGNMVVHTSGGTDARDLVDGQQRLTTMLIAIRAIQSAYEKIEEQGRAEGLAEFIKKKDLSGEITFRLRNRGTPGFLQVEILSNEHSRILNSQPRSEAEKALHTAYGIITDLIDNELENSSRPRVEALDNIRDRFLNATVIYVRASDKRNAFRVFETLNDRGKSLRQIDLVKNQVISAITADGTHEEETTWNQCIELVESTSWTKVGAEDFLGYFWNSTGHTPDDEIVSVTRIRRSVDNYMQSHASHEESAREFIREFHRTSQIFKEFDSCLHAPTGNHWQSIVPEGRWNLNAFRSIDSHLYGCLVPGSNLPLNLLFALFRAYIHPHRRRPISRKLLCEFLTAIERLQFRWSIAKRPSTSTIRRAYRRAAFAVDNANSRNDFRDALSAFRSSAARLMPTDVQFKDGLKSLTYFSQKPADVHRVRHTLERIEQFWGDSRLPRTGQMTLEHIKPQGNYSVNSRTNFWLGKLGNLMLLPGEINSSLPESFEDKSEVLANWVNPHDLKLKQQIRVKEWGNPEANDRMERLLDVALEVWPRELEDDETS